MISLKFFFPTIIFFLGKTIDIEFSSTYFVIIGFKCFNIEVLESIDLDKIKSSGYSFQIEMNFIVWLKKWKINEIPVIFHDSQC